MDKGTIRPFLGLLVVLLVASASAAPSATASPTPEDDGTRTISGTITLPDNWAVAPDQVYRVSDGNGVTQEGIQIHVETNGVAASCFIPFGTNEVDYELRVPAGNGYIVACMTPFDFYSPGYRCYYYSQAGTVHIDTAATPLDARNGNLQSIDFRIVPPRELSGNVVLANGAKAGPEGLDIRLIASQGKCRPISLDVHLDPGEDSVPYSMLLPALNDISMLVIIMTGYEDLEVDPETTFENAIDLASKDSMKRDFEVLIVKARPVRMTGTFAIMEGEKAPPEGHAFRVYVRFVGQDGSGDGPWIYEFLIPGGETTIPFEFLEERPGTYTMNFGDEAGRYHYGYYAPDGFRMTYGEEMVFAGMQEGENDLRQILLVPVDVSFTEQGTDVKIVDPISKTTLTFASIDKSGVTKIKALKETPEGDYFSLPGVVGYFDIDTTASFSGNVRICIPYNPDDITMDEKDLKLFQYVDGVPVDITESVDTENHFIYGVVNHFCIFAITQPIDARTTSATSFPWYLLPIPFVAISLLVAGSILLVKKRRRGRRA